MTVAEIGDCLALVSIGADYHTFEMYFTVVAALNVLGAGFILAQLIALAVLKYRRGKQRDTGPRLLAPFPPWFLVGYMVILLYVEAIIIVKLDRKIRELKKKASEEERRQEER